MSSGMCRPDSPPCWAFPCRESTIGNQRLTQGFPTRVHNSANSCTIVLSIQQRSSLIFSSLAWCWGCFYLWQGRNSNRAPTAKRAVAPEVVLEREIKTMKSFSILVLGMCIFCAAGAVGQANMGSAMSGPVVGFQMPEHPQVASRLGMGLERDLLEGSQSISAKGEMPLWEAMEMMPAPYVTPLGDSAREIRKEHAMAPKAVIVWNN
jgi:hypothetical protein